MVSKRDILEIAGFIIALFSIGYSYYLSEDANLQVWDNLNETSSTLTIWIKNNAIFRETGTVNVFRVEVSDSKPHFQVHSIKPGETMQISLSVNISKITITIPQNQIKYGWEILEDNTTCIIPEYKLYYSTEQDSSITYKITCDNCKSQGIVRRVPDFNTFEKLRPINMFAVNGVFACEGYIHSYRWTQFGINDITNRNVSDYIHESINRFLEKELNSS